MYVHTYLLQSTVINPKRTALITEDIKHGGNVETTSTGTALFYIGGRCLS
jgi:hypothetical protein